MKKIILSFVAALSWIATLSAQPEADSSGIYQQRRLRLDEVNFVSAYYWQDGNNSAVTGGRGTEQLTDFANNLELKLLRIDGKGRRHTLTADIGVDAYSSASSDNIDPATISSASRSDKRIYPGLSYAIANEKTGWTLGGSASYSTEYDYKSYGLGLQAAKQSQDGNRELGIKAQAYFDTWTVILPVELRAPGTKEDGQAPRNSLSASISLAQVINSRLQLALVVDGVYQQGQLATKYQRVYFTDQTHAAEVLPDTRFKLPIGLRASCFMGSRVIVRGFYRYYTDNWGIRSNTIELELPIKINPYLSITPHYRYYNQSATSYFAPYAVHAPSDRYFTSDYDLSKFASHFGGLGIRYVPEKGVLGIARWTMLELRYGYYSRSNGLQSNIISLNARFR